MSTNDNPGRVRVMPVVIAVGIALAAGLLGALTEKLGPALVTVALGGASLGVSALMAGHGEYFASGKRLSLVETRLLWAGLVILGAVVVAIIVDGIAQTGHVAPALLGVGIVVAIAEGGAGLYAWVRR